ncbi:hypothetical protein HYPDE_26513 [Hyphomicrobium denitrificans 1NES1]|uniref:Uncharacterized protein n=1 Tax=Hyphomicrobium denitrificans 1NES1 TaxID=670307 RepID=N0B214_9HYPH|nr:hypothetical protein HYPDE_26513 [Hyphomicrobium denitrificans 1NES1]
MGRVLVTDASSAVCWTMLRLLSRVFPPEGVAFWPERQVFLLRDPSSLAVPLEPYAASSLR